MVVKAEGLGSAQMAEATTTTEGLPQVPGQGPDVGPSRAVNLNGELPAAWIPIEQVEVMNGHRSGRKVHLLTTAGSAVGAFAIHVNRRYLRRLLLNVSAKSVQRVIEFAAVHTGPRSLAQDLSIEVVAAGDGAQLEHSAIGLLSWQVGQQTGCLPKGNRQDTGDRWIQGPTMADASEPIAAPQAADAVVGCHASGFVDHHKAERTVHVR